MNQTEKAIAAVIVGDGQPRKVAMDALIEHMEAKGFRHMGASENRMLRAEIAGLPKFEGMAGPMWGGLDARGKPMARYETWAVNRALSA